MHPVRLYSLRPLISLIALAAFAQSSPVWAAGPAPAAVVPTLASASRAVSPALSTVNPYTGTEASVADLKKTLEIERLRTQIADEKHRQRRSESEAKKFDRPEGMPAPGQFGTLKFPSEKMPDLTGIFFAPGTKGMKGKQPPPSLAPAVPVVAPVPMVPAGPRLVGVIRDEGGRVAIIEQGGVLKQVKEGESAHGQKVAKIGDGWAEVGGKRLMQDKSTLALVTNVDKQPVLRMAAAGGASMAPAPVPVPVAQAMPFMPPNFQ